MGGANLDLWTEAVEKGLPRAVEVLAYSEGVSGKRSKHLQKKKKKKKKDFLNLILFDVMRLKKQQHFS